MRPFPNITRGLIQLLAAGFLLGGHPVWADIMTLTSQNSVIKIDPNSQAGVYDWVVDGTDVMYQQWFLIRSGSDTHEYSVDSSNFNLTAESYSGGRGLLAYAGHGYTTTIRFSLLGGSPGSNAADLSEIISLKNTGTAALTLDFFQYANIMFSTGHDTVQFLNPYSVQQTAGGIYLNETVVNTNGLVHHEANVYPRVVNSLNDNSITTLSDSNYAAGDATWAFQWEKTIAPGSTFTITKDINVVDPPPSIPEPASVLLLGSVLAAVGFTFSRRGAAFRSA